MEKNEVIIRVVEGKIFVIRGHNVMLDAHLAELYGVTTRALNRAVRRNLERFPEDFAFLLTPEEAGNLMYQFGTSSWGGRRKLPFAFTEQGVAMLSSVLNSSRAIKVNIQIMRAFIRLRGFHISLKDLRSEVLILKQKYDKNFSIVFDAIERLFDGPKRPFKIKGFSRVRTVGQGGSLKCRSTGTALPPRVK